MWAKFGLWVGPRVEAEAEAGARARVAAGARAAAWARLGHGMRLLRHRGSLLRHAPHSRPTRCTMVAVRVGRRAWTAQRSESSRWAWERLTERPGLRRTARTAVALLVFILPLSSSAARGGRRAQARGRRPEPQSRGHARPLLAGTLGVFLAGVQRRDGGVVQGQRRGVGAGEEPRKVLRRARLRLEVRTTVRATLGCGCGCGCGCGYVVSCSHPAQVLYHLVLPPHCAYPTGLR